MHRSFKSSNFLNVIDKYAKRQKSKITDEIREMENQALAKAEAEIMDDVNNMIKKELVHMKNKILVEVSHKEVEERKKVSQRRIEMMKEIFKECRNRLINFTNSSDYVKALMSYAVKISKVLREPDTELFIKQSDSKYINEIQEAFGRKCKINVSNDILIGGIRGYSAIRGIIADETLDEKLKEQEDWATENFGTLLV